MDGWYAATVQVMNHYKLKMKKRAQHTLTRRTATRTTRKRTVTSGLPTTRYPLTSNLTMMMMIIIINSIRDFAPKQTLTHVPGGGVEQEGAQAEERNRRRVRPCRRLRAPPHQLRHRTMTD